MKSPWMDLLPDSCVDFSVLVHDTVLRVSWSFFVLTEDGNVRSKEDWSSSGRGPR